jgi:carboxylate-amine ligase
VTDVDGGAEASGAEPTTSVRPTRFGAGDPLTIGVEEEYMILDATTWALAPRFEDVLEAVRETPIAGRVHPELFTSTVEAASGVCRTVDDVRADLGEVRRTLGERLEPLGLAIGGAGAHPFSRSEDQRVSPHDRYRHLVEQLQYVARRELVFGMHVHVAIPDEETCIQVMEALLVDLPVLLALSVNSPFWRGRETGLESTRTSVFAGFPRSGLPPRFDSYDDYADSVAWMEQAGSIGEYTHLWWDIRPHPRLGTLELRVPDVQFDLDSTLALAAFVQCVAKSALEDVAAGHPPRSHHRMLVAENKWLAGRYGVEAGLLDIASGSGVKIRADDLARRRLKELAPHARELGCWDALQGVESILARGTGAMRQRRVWGANGDLLEMMRELARFTMVGSSG